MSGMSDVRLKLYAEELSREQRTQLFSAPTGLSRWGLMAHRWHTRRALLALDAAQLRDVGLTPEQAREEGLKPFWRS
ncbi:DUF1127 domain-containing protein [Pseudomonas sp. BIGb0427]|uniref:YjiS-like domain-containing protein n=1 Tax=Pseudomonas vranovensis TaxID=321661 RepID=A0A423D790_9PSED|nr:MULTISPECIES: DUF1127 domain-containing protein [Pseudomonas]KJK16342.1 hypothetical protein UB48_18240 [Pseudomonas sp. 2(2015)]NLU59686.1 DUF1127 domain-containing protein [Pseudomonas sp. BIGb0427]QPG64382.1 DUF1127 domain-containing protein [Pseudomonas sp. BIGb0427]QVM96871.1 DUF1127 domain-containing protein [Pseudomonas sp. SORT22]ROL67428.1 hypothetical protein BHU25_18105 [Pseudomonas vranovensis]